MDHNALLHELDNLDVDPHLMRWIATFLTNRKQWVRVGTVLCLYQLCLYLPPQDLLDLAIFVLLNIRIMCNILNCNLSYYL